MVYCTYSDTVTKKPSSLSPSSLSSSSLYRETMSHHHHSHAVEFDGKVEYCSAEHGRFKTIEVHPVKPLVLSVDREGIVCLWDFRLKRAVVHTSVHTLFAESHSQRPVISPAKSSYFRQQHDIYDIYNHKPKLQPMYSSRDFESMSASMFGAKMKQCMGSVTQFGFADLSTVLHSNGFSGSSYSDLTALHHLDCSDTTIFLVCEHVVLLYDYFMRQTSCLAMTDSMRKQVSAYTAPTSSLGNTAMIGAIQPTSAELIHFSVCAVGGSDGSIHLWELPRRTSTDLPVTALAPPVTANVLDFHFQTFSKSPMIVIKSIPRKRLVLYRDRCCILGDPPPIHSANPRRESQLHQGDSNEGKAIDSSIRFISIGMYVCNIII